MVKRSRGALLGLAALALFAAADTDRITAAGSDTRVIAFKHIHTNELLSIVYKKDGHYVPEALEKINWIMRDWRKNQVIKIDPAVIDLLWEMHTELGSAEPISIICGYRSHDTNEMLRRTVGGQASQSQHITGKAIDVTFPDVPLKKIRYAALVRERGGVGYYPTSGIPFVHVDTARARYWPRLPRHELALLFPDGHSKYMPADGGPITKDDVRVAQARHKELATQIAAFFQNHSQHHTPMLVADASGRIRNSGRAGGTEIASAEPQAPRPAERRVAETKVASLPPEPPAPRLLEAPRMIERSSRLSPGPAPAPKAVAAATKEAKPADAAPAPRAIASASPAQRAQPAAAPGPSQDDRSRLDELVTLASYQPPAPKLVAEPQRAARRQAFASASIASAVPPPAPPAAPVTEPAAAPARVAALEPARAPQSIDQILTDAGFSSGWVPAPAYDEEHPEELSYRPFPVVPLLTASASADDPVLAHMTHPDVARTIDYINDDGEIPPMRFRPGQQVAQVMWAQQFQGEIISLSTMMAREASPRALNMGAPQGLADRRVKTSSR